MPTPVSVSLRLLILVALWLACPAAANAGKVAILNCSTQKVRLCAYDKTDAVMKIAASSGDLAAGGSVIMTCNYSGGCRVKAQKDTTSNCSAGGDDLNLVGATGLGENAYRFRQDSPGHFVFDRVSEDPGFFDSGSQHRSCTATKTIGQACQSGADCLDGGCLTSVSGGSVCCKANCGTAACQSCSANGQSCVATPYGKNGQYCEQSWQMCDGDRCVWRGSVETGKACVGPIECKSGICADGVCCSSKCDGACQSCNAAGKAGTCSPSERGQNDGGKCDGLCNGSGACLRAKGIRCSEHAQCFSRKCVVDARFPGKGVHICL